MTRSTGRVRDGRWRNRTIPTRLYELGMRMMDLARRREVTRRLRLLMLSQRWSRRRLEEWKDFRVRRLVKHAYSTVPYYRRRMRSLGLAPSDIRSARDLERLPILTKRDIKANFRDMISGGYPAARMALDHTSGSTGEPLTFYRTLYQLSWEKAAELRAKLWHGFRPGDRWGLMYPLLPRLQSRRVIQLLLQRGILFNAVNISEESLGWFVRRLKDTDTRLLLGTANALYLLARFVEKEGADLTLDVVMSSFETLDPDMRGDIGRVFGCRVFDFYGSREVGSIAAQCPNSSRYMVSDEIVHLELIEQGGDGLGDVVVTSLVNYCMPFIRYAIGDVASGIREECDCGRAHTTLASVEGKLEGLIARRGGRFIAAVFSTPFKGMPVWQYSVVQRDYDHFTFLVVPMKGFREKHANIITRKALGILGPAEVEFIEVDRIPPLPGGKHRYVTSEVPYKPPWLET